MTTPAIDDELRDFLRADVLSEFGVSVTYKKNDGTPIVLTAARGEDEDLGDSIQRLYSISVADLPTVAEGETITDDGVVWTVVDATTRPTGGMHGLLARTPRLHPATAPAGA